MKGSTFRRCGCRNPATGKQWGKSCPQLKRKNHGTWAVRQELPADAEGKRRTFRRFGYDTATKAQADLDAVRALLALPDEDDQDGRRAVAELLLTVSQTRAPIPDRDETALRLRTGQSLTKTLTVGDYLDEWLAGKKKIVGNTTRGYRSHIELYLKPYLGHRRLDRLQIPHIGDLFDWFEERNEIIREARETGDRTRLSELPGKRHRFVGPATQERIRATLRNALNDAIRRRLLTFNPAQFVELDRGARPKPLLWTDERVQRWRETGEVPGTVMVWTPALTGAFLDHAAEHRMYALFHLVAFRGLRRGEACGQPWTDINFERAELTVSQQIVQYGKTVEVTRPKSDAGARTIALDAENVAVLRAHRARQLRERMQWGEAWEDSGLVFTRENGEAYHPADVTDAFRDLVESAGLPPIRVHDLRHGAATLALAAGADLATIKDMLGHSTITITADTYTSVLPELAREVAEAAVRLVPRAHTGTAGLTSGSHESPGETPAVLDTDESAGQRRAWDSNPRTESPQLAVFKSPTPPDAD